MKLNFWKKEPTIKNRALVAEILKAEQGTGYLIMISRYNKDNVGEELKHRYFQVTFPDGDIASSIDEQATLLKERMAKQ